MNFLASLKTKYKEFNPMLILKIYIVLNKVLFLKIIENIYFLKKFNYKLFNFSSKFYSVLIAISPCKTHILVEKHVISKITATAQIFSPKNFMIDFFFIYRTGSQCFGISSRCVMSSTTNHFCLSIRASSVKMTQPISGMSGLAKQPHRCTVDILKSSY